MELMLKRCSRCKRWKGLEDGFYRDRKRRNGRCSQCKRCMNTQQAVWGAANRDKRAAAKAARYPKVRGKILAQQAEYRATLAGRMTEARRTTRRSVRRTQSALEALR